MRSQRHVSRLTPTRSPVNKVTHLAALWACKPTAVLSLEQVDNDRVVALLVQLPAGRGKRHLFLVASALPIRDLIVRLLLDAIEVFVQPIEEESEELLAIVLLPAGESGSEFGQSLLELARGDWRVAACPDPLNERAKGFGNLSVHTERVVRIELRPVEAGCRGPKRRTGLAGAGDCVSGRGVAYNESTAAEKGYC